VSPHVARVYDLVVEGDRPWIVMQLLPGRTLRDALADGPLTPGGAARVALDVLAALDATHKAGVVHRDVKPGNVLLADGHAVLVDFGIATTVDDHSATSPAMLLGSPAYMAPERAEGRPSGPAADIWSLGALLFATLQGGAPYERDHPIATVHALLFEPVPAADRAGGLAPLVAAMLSREPQQRPTIEQARRVLLLSHLRELDAPSPSHHVLSPQASSTGRAASSHGEVSSADHVGEGDGHPEGLATAPIQGVRHAAAHLRRGSRWGRSPWHSTHA
jgi:serine/threonine protein kinase